MIKSIIKAFAYRWTTAAFNRISIEFMAKVDISNIRSQRPIPKGTLILNESDLK